MKQGLAEVRQTAMWLFKLLIVGSSRKTWCYYPKSLANNPLTYKTNTCIINASGCKS